jgi:uncharacterized coiled-coil DUF342 family protein
MVTMTDEKQLEQEQQLPEEQTTSEAESSQETESSEQTEETVKEAPQEETPKADPASDLSPEELKEKLSNLNEKKESAFSEKQKIGSLIAEKIRQIGELKKTRNSLTKDVQDLKKERDQLNAQITAKIEEIKKESPKKDSSVSVPTDAKGRPLRAHAIAKQINVLKKDANVLHAKVTDSAKKSQEHHEMMLKLGSEIDELKKQEETHYQDFLKHKQEYVGLSGEAHVVDQEQKKMRNQKRDAQRRARKKEEEEKKKTLKARAEEAQEKMNSGKKLTTEDLLALQGLD